MSLDVFGRDFILGNFRASDYGLILATFENNGVSDNNIGMSTDTSEVFVGTNPIPIYSGDRHNEKLRPTITLCRNPSVFLGDKKYGTNNYKRLCLHAYELKFKHPNSKKIFEFKTVLPPEMEDIMK